MPCENLFCFPILLLKVIHFSQLVVVVGDIRLDGDVFEEFCFSPFQILFLQVTIPRLKWTKGRLGSPFAARSSSVMASSYSSRLR